MAALAAVLALRGQWASALFGVAIVLAAALAVVRGAPWRHPQTRYGWLMAAPLLLQLLAVAWAWEGLAAPPPQEDSWSPWMLAWLLPLVLPMLALGTRRWADGDPPETSR